MKNNISSLTFRFIFFIIISINLLFSINNKAWKDIEKKAQGQTVYFHAWGGLESINEYIAWASQKIKKKYKVKLKHVKITDAALSVKQIISDQKTGNKGSVDLIWINGENFKTLKNRGLLTPRLNMIIPGIDKIDYKNNPSAKIDFSEPVEGFEIPWGIAKFVFIYDTTKLSKPPLNHKEILSAVKNRSLRFTYPAPPEFHGTTFLKQILYETINKKDIPALSKPVDQKTFIRISQPLWSYLDQLHPHLWRGGKNFPSSLGAMNQLFKDSEILLSMSFNPNFVDNQICLGEFPKTVKSSSPQGGSIGNTHFLAVPNNSQTQEGAFVAIAFLISAEAQAQKFNSCHWGDPTILDIKKLSSQEKKRFSTIPRGIENALNLQLSSTLLEPHASWTESLEKEWIKRYGF